MTTRTRAKKVTQVKFRVRINVEKDGEGYHSYTPSLRGIHMGGDTPEEALSIAKEAAALMLKSMIKHGDTIPVDLLEPQTGKKKAVCRKDLIMSMVEEITVNL